MVFVLPGDWSESCGPLGDIQWMHGGTKAREAINQRFLVMIPSVALRARLPVQARFPVRASVSRLATLGTSSRGVSRTAKNIIALETPPSGLHGRAHSHFLAATAHEPSAAVMRPRRRSPTGKVIPLRSPFLQENGIQAMPMENPEAFSDKMDVVYQEATSRIGADLIEQARDFAAA
jgi:hypothetical protein